MAMEREVKKAVSIDEGKHTGKITHLEQRTEPYMYIDVFIQVTSGKDKDIELKYGCPDSVSESSRLGKLIKAVTGKLEVGKTIDLEQELVNKQVTFMTINEETDRGTFARIVDGSIKPTS